MKRYFLVSNRSECLLFLDKYAQTHIPFVLNVHEFRCFDAKNISYVTIGHFETSQEMRGFCKGFLDFLRRFVDEMDTRNMLLAKDIFGREIRLFSVIAYNIFTAFYNLFRFVNCINLMRNSDECEIIIPFALADRELPTICWAGMNQGFHNNDAIFKFVSEYFIDASNLMVKKVLYESTGTITRTNLRIGVKTFIRSFQKRLGNIRFTVNMGKHKRFVLAMDDFNLWYPVLNAKSIRDTNEPVNLIPLDAFYKGKYKGGSEFPPKLPTIELFRTEHQHDAFLPFFRSRDIIQDVLIERYGEILSESVPLVEHLKNLFSNREICGVVGTACGAIFLHPLVSQLARDKKITVIGMQHGGQYGYMDFFDKMGYSDYYSCDFWFSWGFDTNYLKRTFRSSGPPIAEIVPVGSTAISHFIKSRKRSRKKIKIMYVMAFNLRLTESTYRIDDFRLFRLQKEILGRLFSSNSEILIKPPKGVAGAFDDKLRDVPSNITVTREPLRTVLKSHDLAWIVMDILSTPFEETCVTESQILAFNDSIIWPIEPYSRSLMEKRAWIFDDEEGFLEMLDGILAGRTFDKRLDNCFEKQFILPYGQNTLGKTGAELCKLLSGK